MKNYLKIAAILTMIWVIPMAFLGEVSVQPVLHETIRNLYWHVTMWFSMFVLLLAAVVHGIIYLRTNNSLNDEKSLALTQVALVYGLIGIATGMIWARFTWDTFWTKDPQLNGAAITILAYLAYMVLRSSITDARKRAEISAVYGIFAFVLMVVLIVILPRMQDVDSLHPGKGGNPGFGNYKDLKNDMRLVFYPAILGWTLMGFWMANLSFRIQRLTRNTNATH